VGTILAEVCWDSVGNPGLVMSVDKWSRTKSIKEDMLKAIIKEGVIFC
jgi:hypothetical protein